MPTAEQFKLELHRMMLEAMKQGRENAEINAGELHRRVGGKFFRFRPDQASANVGNSSTDSPTGHHGAQHYWLCERCSRVLTLVDGEGCGVVLKLLGRNSQSPKPKRS